MKLVQELKEISRVREGAARQSAQQKQHGGATGFMYSRHQDKLIQPDRSTRTNTIHPSTTTKQLQPRREMIISRVSTCRTGGTNAHLGFYDYLFVNLSFMYKKWRKSTSFELSSNRAVTLPCQTAGVWGLAGLETTVSQFSSTDRTGPDCYT